jgi:hypothetical protein
MFGVCSSAGNDWFFECADADCGIEFNGFFVAPVTVCALFDFL